MAEPPASRRLNRVVRLPGAVLLGLGSILGTGVFVSLGIAAGVAGSALVPAVAFAGLLATANGLSSAQLAAAHPVSGGTYEYGYRYVHPLAGFVAGWMYLAAKSASAATAALGAVGYALHALGWPLSDAARVGLALAVVAVLTGLVAAGLKRSNVVNAALVGCTLAALAVFAFVAPSGVSSTVALQRLAVPVDAIDPRAVLGATALLFVAYTGYGRVATLGEEVVDPARTIPRAVVATLAVSAAVYLAVACAAVVAVGAPGFAAATGADGAPLQQILDAVGRPTAARVVAFGAITAMLGVLLNLVLGLSRVLLAMARRADLPTPLAHVGDLGPTRAVVTMGAVVGALVLVGDVRLTWSFSAVTVLAYYGLTNLAALRLPAADRRVPRAVPVAGLVGCFGLAAFVEPRVLVAAVAVLAAGLVLRAVVRRGVTSA